MNVKDVVKEFSDDQVSMKMRDQFITKAEDRLAAWKEILDKLHTVKPHLRTEVEPTFHSMLHHLDSGHARAQQKLQNLRLISPEEWPQRKQELEQVLINFAHKFDHVQEMIDQAEVDTIGWPEGFAKNFTPDSIGWAEGFTEEEAADSVGWAEGFTDEVELESKGWVEGYEQK